MTDLARMGQCGVISADPPWSYRDLGHTRRIDRQYSIMRKADIVALPVIYRLCENSAIIDSMVAEILAHQAHPHHKLRANPC